ncbi:MAG: recombinase family protein [Bacilli bacterium]|nr:recombinase family protein [Bacilli bacterium]
MNVVIYARYSSHNQSEQSIEGQLLVCKEYAKRNDYNVVGEYIDRAISGTSDNRPEFLKMIEDSNKKHFNGVLVYQLDRFARNRYDSALYKNKLKKNNVRVLSARENISDDASGVLMESVLEGMAEYFSVELGQKVKRGMSINADKCYYNGGTVPLGYKLVEADRILRVNNKPMIKRKYAIHEENAPIIKKVFEMYTESSTMADIIRYLNNNQLKTAHGNPFNKNSIRRLLLNKKYIGIYEYNGKETKDGIPRIIDYETFERVQEMLIKNKTAPARARAKTEYLLTTKLFCGHCKEMMTGVSGTSGTGKLHTYYCCSNVRKKKCNKKTIQKEIIERFVVKKAKEQLTDENINLIANIVVELAEKDKENSNLKKLNKLLKDNEKQKNNLFDSLKICELDNVRKSIFEEISKVDTERIGLEKEIIEEESKFVKITVPQVKYFLNHLKKGNIDDESYRKRIINVLVYKVYLYDDNDITILFTIQNKVFEGKIPSIEDIESSFKGNVALPLREKVEIL